MLLGTTCQQISIPITTPSPYVIVVTQNRILKNRTTSAGTQITTTTNACIPNPCQNSGLCIANSKKNFTCFCTSQFTGL